MKNGLKKFSLSLLAVLTVLSVLSQFTVFAKTGTVVKNTGVRHTVCVELSDQAEKYYSDNNASYDELSALKGGSANCLTTVDSVLFDELHDLMTVTMTKNVSYDALPTYWEKTDANNGSSTYWYFYSDQLDTSSLTINREHVWCKSNASFDEKNGGADPHHLRPAVSGVNQSRSDKIFGNVKGVVSNYTVYPKTGKVALYHSTNRVEVNDNIKGDVARVLLYVYCRWEEPNLFMETTNPVIGPSDSQNKGGRVIESLKTLLQWCKIDPVDEWEMSRNDQCENLVGNRNVFIDYPEYAWLLFGEDIPSDMVTPSGEAKELADNQGGNDNNQDSNDNQGGNHDSNDNQGNTNNDNNNQDNNSQDNNGNTNNDNGGSDSSIDNSNQGSITNKPNNSGKPYDPNNVGNQQAQNNEADNGMDTGVIIAIIVGSVVIIGILIVVIVIIVKKKKNK